MKAFVSYTFNMFLYDLMGHLLPMEHHDVIEITGKNTPKESQVSKLSCLLAVSLVNTVKKSNIFIRYPVSPYVHSQAANLMRILRGFPH